MHLEFQALPNDGSDPRREHVRPVVFPAELQEKIRIFSFMPHEKPATSRLLILIQSSLEMSMGTAQWQHTSVDPASVGVSPLVTRHSCTRSGHAPSLPCGG